MPSTALRFVARRIVLLMLALAGPVAARAPGTARDLRVMTFNVRYPNPDDGPNIWANRRALFAQTIAAADPDVIGTQELFAAQGGHRPCAARLCLVWS